MPAELKYQEKNADIAFNMALLGAIDKNLARAFKVSEKTIKQWRQKYPKFQAALHTGKEEADGRVASSLFQRALGYSHKAVKIFCQQGKTFEHEYIERYPPDTVACIFWLKNRQREYWRDRVENVVSGGDRMDEVLAVLKHAQGNQGNDDHGGQ